MTRNWIQNWSLKTLVLFVILGLASCGGGGSPTGISTELTPQMTGSEGQQSTSPQIDDGLYEGLANLSYREMKNHLYDPGNLMANNGLNDQGRPSFNPDDYRTVSSMSDQDAYEIYEAEEVARLVSKGTSSFINSVWASPMESGPLSSDPTYIMRAYNSPWGANGAIDVSFEVGGVGVAYLGVSNFQTLRVDWFGSSGKSASGITEWVYLGSTKSVNDFVPPKRISEVFTAGSEYTVKLNDPFIQPPATLEELEGWVGNQRRFSPMMFGAVGRYWLVTNDTAIIKDQIVDGESIDQALRFTVVPRYQDLPYFGGTGGYMFNVRSTAVKSASASAEVYEGPSTLVEWDFDLDANPNTKTYVKGDSTFIGGKAAEVEQYMDSIDNVALQSVPPKAGTTHYYVQGLNNDGLSVWVETDQPAHQDSLLPATSITAVYDDANQQVVVAWVKSLQPVDAYTLKISDDGGATWVDVNVGDVATYTHDVSAVTDPHLVYKLVANYTNPNDSEVFSSESQWAYCNLFIAPLADAGSVTGHINSIQANDSSNNVYMVVSDETNYDVYAWTNGSSTADDNVTLDTGTLVAATFDSGTLYFLSTNTGSASEGLRLYAYDTSDGSISETLIEGCSYSGENLVYQPGNATDIKVINGTVTIIYSSGTGNADLKYYEVGGGSHTVITASGSVGLLCLNALSTYEPRLSYMVGGELSVACANTANPSGSGNWTITVPTGISGSTRLAVGNDLLWLFSAQNQRLQFSYSANSNPTVGEWTTINLTATSGPQYGYPGMEVASVGGSDIPILTYAVRASGSAPWYVYCLSTGHVTGVDTENAEQNFIDATTSEGVWKLTDLSRSIPVTALGYRSVLSSAGGKLSYMDTVLDWDGASATYDAKLFCGSL
ncbi:MAG: hypothetical protein R3B38_00465 [Patescibacteria group bacterium]